MLFRQKHGKRASFAGDRGDFDIAALAGYDLSGKV